MGGLNFYNMRMNCNSPTHCLLLLLILLNHLFLLHLSYCLLCNSFIKFSLRWPKFLQHENELQLSHTLPPPLPYSPQPPLSPSYILLFLTCPLTHHCLYSSSLLSFLSIHPSIHPSI